MRLRAVLAVPILASASVALALAYVTPASAVTIDSFDSGESFVLDPVSGETLFTQPAQVLGGTREIRAGSRIDFDSSLGLDMFGSAGRTAMTVITYRMPETDLTAGGADRFQVTLAPTPLPADWVYLAILVNGPEINEFSSGRAELVAASGVIEFELFPPTGIPAMASAHHISLHMYGYREDQGGSIVRLLDFRTVPEPTRALLGVISALAVVAARRLASKLDALLRGSEFIEHLKPAAAQLRKIAASVAPGVVAVVVLLGVLGCASLRLRESDGAGRTTAKVVGRIVLGITTLGISEIHYSDWRQRDERAAARNASTIRVKAALDACIAQLVDPLNARAASLLSPGRTRSAAEREETTRVLCMAQWRLDDCHGQAERELIQQFALEDITNPYTQAAAEQQLSILRDKQEASGQRLRVCMQSGGGPRHRQLG